jgi:rhamnogalacturonan endolyase
MNCPCYVLYLKKKCQEVSSAVILCYSLIHFLSSKFFHMLCRLFPVILIIMQLENAAAQKVICTDGFESGLDNWIIEKVSEKTTLTLKDGKLEVVASNGITLWYHQRVKSPAKIVFDAMVVGNGGQYDRVSDLNCFWMANDPEHPDSFFTRSDWRNGVFGKYYSLTMYYAGFGGNNNSTTRFRRYDGNYQQFIEKKIRPEVIQEYTDSAHLITPNQWYHVEIVVTGNKVQYFMNNKLLFDYYDPHPYSNGYFGLRTVKNHIKYKNFKIIQL